jgi:addiction module HigA family antidote
MERLAPVHPGEVLWHEFMEPLGLSQNALAKAVGVPPRRINEIMHGARRITADTALRLSRYFSTSAAFWLNLQSHHDLEVAAEALGDSLARIRPRELQRG